MAQNPTIVRITSLQRLVARIVQQEVSKEDAVVPEDPIVRLRMPGWECESSDDLGGLEIDEGGTRSPIGRGCAGIESKDDLPVNKSTGAKGEEKIFLNRIVRVLRTEHSLPP